VIIVGLGVVYERCTKLSIRLVMCLM